MTDSKARAAEPSLFQGLASSPAREATRRATRHFCFNLLASVKIGRSISTLAACDLSPVDSLRLLPGAFESPTSTIIVRIFKLYGI